MVEFLSVDIQWSVFLLKGEVLVDVAREFSYDGYVSTPTTTFTASGRCLTLQNYLSTVEIVYYSVGGRGARPDSPWEAERSHIMI
ncbi:MAG: hypothetical protein QXT13_11185 [Pyrobaculum sp.]